MAGAWGLGNREVLLGEGDPGVAFVVEAVAAGDVERDLKLEEGAVEAGLAAFIGDAEFAPKLGGSHGVELEKGVDFLRERGALPEGDVMPGVMSL